jgi:hypothetical protein
MNCYSRVHNSSKTIIILFLLLLTACGKPATPLLPADEIVTRSTTRTKDLQGFHFVIDRSGAPAYLDYNETLNFSRAEGDFVAPDRARAAIRIIAPGIVAEIHIVGIGESYWETNLVSGEWQSLPAGTGFNPAVLFDPQIGFQPVLESDLTNLELIGIEELEELPGQSLYLISGQLRGDRLFLMSYEMIGPETMDVRLWIAPDTFDLYRVIITEPTPDPDNPTIWQLDFWDFNSVADIYPPPVP